METQTVPKLQFVVYEPIPAPTPSEVIRLTACTLNCPLSAARLERQVGRFCLINYTPVEHPDPDIVLGLTPECLKFNRVMVEFQKVRDRREVIYNRAGWFDKIRRRAGRVLSALNRLHPTGEEAAFVEEWVQDVCVTQRTI